MAGYKDGFKRGTNCHYRSRMANYDPRAEIALGMALRAACGRGEHDETTVKPRYRVWSVAGKRYRAAGERYCRRCGEDLGTVHLVPLTGGRLPCCGRLPRELPGDARVCEDPAQVTCTGEIVAGRG